MSYLPISVEELEAQSAEHLAPRELPFYISRVGNSFVGGVVAGGDVEDSFTFDDSFNVED